MEKVVQQDLQPSLAQLFLQLRPNSGELTAVRLIGMESENCYLFSVNFSNGSCAICSINPSADNLDLTVWHEISNSPNILSATLNLEIGILVFVTLVESDTPVYQPNLILFNNVESDAEQETKGYPEIFKETYATYIQFQFLKSGAENNMKGDRTTPPLKPTVTTGSTVLSGSRVSVHQPPKVCSLLMITLGGSLTICRIRYGRTPLGIRLVSDVDLELVVSHLVWAQWDPMAKRLFTVHPGDNHLCSLSSYQFDEAAFAFTRSRMFTYSLDWPYPKPGVMMSSFPSGFRLNHIVSCPELNAVVLVHSNGSICFCAKRLPWCPAAEQPLYTIHLLHERKQIIGSYQDCHISCAILFLLSGSNLVAIGDSFVHIVDLTLYAKSRLSFLIPYRLFTPNDGDYQAYSSVRGTSMIYRNSPPTFISLKPAMTVWVNQFAMTSFQQNKLAILNHIVTTCQEIDVQRSLFQKIFSKPALPDLQSILSEYLIASIFARFLRYTGKDFAPYIRSTMLEERTQERVLTPSGKLGSYLTLRTHVVSPNNILLDQLAIADDRQKAQETLWRRFTDWITWHNDSARCETFEQQKVTFTVPPDAKTGADAKDFTVNNTPSASLPPSSKGPTLISSIMGSMSRVLSTHREPRPLPAVQTKYNNYLPPSKADCSAGPLPYYLQEPLLTADQKAQMEYGIRDYFRQPDSKGRDAPQESQLWRIVDEYIASTMTQIRLLFHMAHCLLGSHMTRADHLALASPFTSDDRPLYHAMGNIRFMLQREGFPIPADVERIYLRLAFRCLSPRIFVQNLRWGILPQIDPEFVQEIIELRPATLELDKLRKEIRNSLSMEVRLKLFKKFTLAEQKDIIQEYTIDMIPDTSSTADVSADGPINPATEYLRSVRQWESKLQRPRRSAVFKSAFADFRGHEL